VSVAVPVLMVAASLLVIWAGDFAVGIAGVVFFGLAAVVALRSGLRPDRPGDLWLVAIGSFVFAAVSFALVHSGILIAGVAGVLLFGLGFVLAVKRLVRPERAASPVSSWSDRATGWFPADPDLAPTSDESAFLKGLARSTRRWPSDGVRSHAARDDYDDRLLVALVAVVADGHEVLVVGVHLDEGRVRGDRLDNNRQPSQPPTTLVLPTSSTGDTALTSHSVEHVSTWFDAILRRPVERLEWWHNGVPYAVRDQFADTCEALCEAYDSSRAPGGPWARLIAKGRDRAPGWTRTGDLGPPDRAVPIRRDGDVVATPALPPFVWYECPLAVL